MIKTSSKIRKIKRSCKITDLCFRYLLTQIKPGLTETQIAELIMRFITNHGAELAFPPITAFDQSSSEPHHIPSDSCSLKADSLVLLDIGAKFDGYCSDMTRVIFMGKPTEEQHQVFNLVKKAQEKAISLINNGERNCKSLDQYTKDFISDNSYPAYKHSLGHGVGKEIHEDPRLSIKRDHFLAPGMVFTIEPGIYLEGKFGVRIEDTVLLTENGIKILTKSPKNLVVIT